METFEIRDKTINEEEIRKIIENQVKLKREKGVYDRMLQEYFERQLEQFEASKMYVGFKNSEYKCKILFRQPITSHRKILGPIIVWFKKIFSKLTHGILERNLEKQEEFNYFVVKSLQSIGTRLERIELERKLKIY